MQPRARVSQQKKFCFIFSFLTANFTRIGCSRKGCEFVLAGSPFPVLVLWMDVQYRYEMTGKNKQRENIIIKKLNI